MAHESDITSYIAGHTIIRHTDIDPALLAVEAVIDEQDTNLLLGKSPIVMDTIESFPALVTRMEQQAREVPGNIIIKHTIPKRFIAIVYDVEHDPICLHEWVEQALTDVLKLCKQYKIESLSMPMLGTSCGSLRQEVILRTLQELLIQLRQDHPNKILIYHLDE